MYYSPRSQLVSTSSDFTDNISMVTFRHFQIASNEFSTPKILICNADADKTKTSEWSRFTERNLSYFVNLSAKKDDAQAFLVGDRNLNTNGVVLKPGLNQLSANSSLGWTPAIHKNVGNFGLADGSVQTLSTENLRTQLQKQTNVTRLLLPEPK